MFVRKIRPVFLRKRNIKHIIPIRLGVCRYMHGVMKFKIIAIIKLSLGEYLIYLPKVDLD